MRITGCRSCGSTALEPFLDLGEMPLADGLLRREQLDRPEKRYPLEVAWCADCSLVQILETVDPEELFCQDYPYFSSFSDALLEHSRKNVESLIASRGLGASDLVVEIASNDGYLLQYYAQAGIPVLGIDPAAGPAEAARRKGIETINDFFGIELAERLRAGGKAASVIHANNVLAHVADTNGFVRGIAALLADDGVAVIEAPYVRELIDHCEFDTIYHEHLCYFSVTALRALFARHGLVLNHVDHLSIHGGSLRMFVEKVDRTSDDLRADLAGENERGLTGRAYYEGFAKRVEGVREHLVAMVDDLTGSGHSVAAYGAAAKGATLLNYCGLDATKIDYVVDRNTHKQGRFMPGVHLEVHAPERLIETMPSHVVMLPWNFKDEILRQQADYRQRGGKFIIPIPEPVVV